MAGAMNDHKLLLLAAAQHIEMSWKKAALIKAEFNDFIKCHFLPAIRSTIALPIVTNWRSLEMVSRAFEKLMKVKRMAESARKK